LEPAGAAAVLGAVGGGSGIIGQVGTLGFAAQTRESHFSTPEYNSWDQRVGARRDPGHGKRTNSATVTGLITLAKGCFMSMCQFGSSIMSIENIETLYSGAPRLH
jgi:hypothetical protein